MENVKILLIDDCDESGFLVKVSLKPYLVKQAFSIAEGRSFLGDDRFDLILIDVMLPDGDGFKVCNELQSESSLKNVPKILLTSKGSVSDKVLGLNCGADDYITKPFASAELKARVDVRLRATKPSDSAKFSAGCFTFDSDFHRCTVQVGADMFDLSLTPTEFRLFVALVRNHGIPMSRKELVTSLWRSHGANVEARGIDTHIAHLRKKLGGLGSVIVSVYAKGYTFKLPDAA